MKIEPLSSTYARALMELAQKKDLLRPVLESVRVLEGFLKEDRTFRAFVETPSIRTSDKHASLERIFRGKIEDLVLNFLELVIDKNRQFLLPEIFAECEVLYDKAVGRIHIQAITAVEIGEDLQRELMEALGKRIGKEVLLVKQVRPEMLGGIVLRYQDLVADDSLSTALEEIRHNMMSHKPGSELVHEN